VLGQCEQRAARETNEHARQAEAFVLGTRASVYESTCLWSAAITAYGIPTAKKKAAAEAGRQWNAELAGNDMAIAAGPLGINLSAREEPRMLDHRIRNQLQDTYSRRVVAAYALGRLLGHYDERSYIVVSRSGEAVVFRTAPELTNDSIHTRWCDAVDSLTDEIGVGIHHARPESNSLWAWCAGGRVALETTRRVLGSLRQGEKAETGSAQARDDWSFQFVVTWEPGAWVTRMAVVVPGEFDRNNYTGVENMIGRNGWGWRPEFP